MDTHHFSIEPIDRFATQNAAIRRPREITCFSYDENHQYRPDASSLRYYYPPYLPADLNRGFETFRQLDDSQDEHLDGLLDAIMGYEREVGKKLDVDIVTWRGMMTKIMTAPYSPLDGWEMNATRFQDTIFIEENHTKKQAARDEQNSRPAWPGAMSQDLMSFWGYKFESLCLMEKPWSEMSRSSIENRENDVVSNYAQYCSVVRTGFGGTKIVIGGEVDAIMDQKSGDKNSPNNWIELKTSAAPTHNRSQIKFERKLLKFWAQSFLLGVPKIIVGFRTEQGQLERLEELDVQSIPDKVKLQGNQLWDGQACINFAASLLDWLKVMITSEGVWRVRKREKVPVIEVFRLEESGTGDILSQSFLEWRQHGLLEVIRNKQDQTGDVLQS